MGGRNSKSKGDVLPNSLPQNWPNPSEEDIKECPTRNIIVNGPQGYLFASNFIRTSKYTAWNFLPKFLAQSFHPRKKMANVYFFLISCMQMVSEVAWQAVKWQAEIAEFYLLIVAPPFLTPHPPPLDTSHYQYLWYSHSVDAPFLCHFR